MDKFDPMTTGIVGGVLALIALFIVIGWATTNANTYYYETASKCIQSGAQWLPMGSGAYNGFCIRASDK